MLALFALALTGSVAHADITKEVPGLNGSGIPVQVVAPRVSVEVTCADTDKATAVLKTTDATLTLASEPLTGTPLGAKFIVAGTGSGKLTLTIPKDVKLQASALEKGVKVSGCKGTVTLKGKPDQFDVNTPGADVTIDYTKGRATKPSVIADAKNISVTMPDIQAKVTSKGISVTMPDIAPQQSQGKDPVTVVHQYGTDTTAIQLTAQQAVLLKR